MLYHGTRGLTDLAETVEVAFGTIRKHADRFDSIVATGVSGLVVAAPLAVMLGKPLVVVRKKDDQSTHSGNIVENASEIGARWLFVDDFISLGGTRKRVQEQVAAAAAERGGAAPRMVADYVYREDRLRWMDED